MAGTLQVGGVTLGTHNSGTGKVDLTNAGTLDNVTLSGTLTGGTISGTTTFPANSICYAKTYVGSSGSDYDLETAFTQTSPTNNTPYYTNNYFKYTPKYNNSLLLISGGMASKFGRSGASDCGFSFFVGVTPTGGSESFPTTLTEYTAGNSHSIMYYSSFNSADNQWYHTYNGSYTVSNTNEYLFKIHLEAYNCTVLNFNTYSSKSQVHLFEVKQ